MIFQEKVGVQSVRLALSILAGSALFAGNVQAQEVSAPAEKAQRVEITGSNIKRTDKEGTSPIQSITAKEIRESGAATVADLLKKVPALGGGNALDSLDGSFSRGIATASLRGLGSSSTLILLNGRRMSPAAYANPNNGQSTLYDLNSIPLSALERIDIFKDGASAVYGSDAIAGVINFITKQDYQGLEVSGSGSANGDSKFGRQKANPAEILNRWIVPMERHIDYLSFHAGGKMTVPFAAFLIFSTNLRPDQLGDEAFLRRIQYKMFLRSPGRSEFIQIFERFAESRLLTHEPGVIDGFVEKYYVKGGKRYRRCHPRDVISHAIDLINFEARPKKLTADVLDRAFDSCFTDNIDVND